MNTKKGLPNFLIVGAAKSGTTSVYKYLDMHEYVVFSTPKEPKYFTSSQRVCPHNGPGDDKIPLISLKEQYLECFGDTDAAKAIGDGSADNLYYYKEVIPKIKEELGDPNIYIFLRNPIDRAFSAYMHMRRENRELHTSFENALIDEEKRIQEGWEFIWHYKRAGLYYDQVKAYLDNFCNCKVYLFEDLHKDKQSIIDEICRDLGLETIIVNSDKKYNVSGIPNLNSPKQYFYYKYFKTGDKKILKEIVKKLLPKKIRDSIRNYLTHNWYEKKLIKEKMNTSTRKELIEYYRNDILKLQELLNVNLSHWLK